MLGLDYIKANRETVERAIRDKNVDLDLDTLLSLDTEVRGGKTEIDRLRAERNAVSARFKDATAEERAELGRQAKGAGARASELEGHLAGKEAELKALMLRLPGIPYDGAPVGPDESFNTVIRTVGEPPKFGFEPLGNGRYRVRGDYLLGEIFFSLGEDGAWHRAWAQALGGLAESADAGNRDRLAGWARTWGAAATDAVGPLASELGIAR
jgi:seryl-tRNA synthetase